MELKPKKYGGYKDKGKAKNFSIVLQDVGPESGDGCKVSAVGVQGKDEGISIIISQEQVKMYSLLLNKW